MFDNFSLLFLPSLHNQQADMIKKFKDAFDSEEGSAKTTINVVEADEKTLCDNFSLLFFCRLPT